MDQISGKAADRAIEPRMAAPRQHRTPSPLEAAGARRQAVRVLGTLWILGGALGALFLALPHPEEADEMAMLVLIAVALVGGLLFLLIGQRLPRFLIHAAVAVGTAVLALSIFVSGDVTSSTVLLFVWPVVFSAYFFRTRELAFQLAVVGATYGAVLIAHPQRGSEGIVSPWLTGIAGLTVAAALMAHLTRQPREAEGARQHLAELVEASSEPIIGTSTTGVIESWNRGGRAARILEGRRRESTAGLARAHRSRRRAG